MQLIFQYFWAFLSLTVLGQLLVFKFQARKFVAEKPELAQGYDKFFKLHFVLWNVPILIMMIGSFDNPAPTFVDYANSNTENIWVALSYISLGLVVVVEMFLIYFRKGAEFLENHPGIVPVSFAGKTRNIKVKDAKIIFPIIALVPIIVVIRAFL